MDYALNLLIPFMLCLYGGYWLDTHWGWLPWGTVMGSILGMTLGVGVLYKRAVLTQKADELKQMSQQSQLKNTTPQQTKQERTE